VCKKGGNNDENHLKVSLFPHEGRIDEEIIPGERLNPTTYTIRPLSIAYRMDCQDPNDLRWHPVMLAEMEFHFDLLFNTAPQLCTNLLSLSNYDKVLF
jgi:hypothetical protein